MPAHGDVSPSAERWLTKVRQTNIPVAISYSGGASSKWMIHAVIHGLIPRPQHLAVITADTAIEHDWTYEDIERTKADCLRAGIPFIQCAAGESLPDHLLRVSRDGSSRADQPPLWIATRGGGMGRAQHRCTKEFKVAPMRRAQSAWLHSLDLRKRIVKWVGFAADEVARAVKSSGKQEVEWETLDFPAIRLGRRRDAQRAELRAWGVAVPRFSMCTICPWKKAGRRWNETPERQLQKVYEIDEAIRDAAAIGLDEGEAYLSSALIPVSRLIKHGAPQLVLPGMDLAGCDAGPCFL